MIEAKFKIMPVRMLLQCRSIMNTKFIQTAQMEPQRISPSKNPRRILTSLPAEAVTTDILLIWGMTITTRSHKTNTRDLRHDEVSKLLYLEVNTLHFREIPSCIIKRSIIQVCTYSQRPGCWTKSESLELTKGYLKRSLSTKGRLRRPSFRRISRSIC